MRPNMLWSAKPISTLFPDEPYFTLTRFTQAMMGLDHGLANIKTQ